MAVAHENLSGAERPPPSQEGLNGSEGLNVSNVRDTLKYRAELEATLPPTPVQELLAASGATVFVLATDPGFVATVRRAADRHPLFVVESWAELEEAVKTGRCGIALLDAAMLGSRLPERIQALQPYAARLVTLVAADRATAQDYVGLLSDGRIHRLLIKPPAVGAVRLLIESATARRLLLREEHANDVPSAVPEAATGGLSKWGLAAAAGIGAAILIGIGVAAYQLDWLNRFRGPDAAVALPVPPAVSEPVPPTPEEQVAELHAQASLARAEGRLAEPVGVSALDHYLAILTIAPADPGARGGVTAVVEGLFAQAEEALLADSLETAAAALDHVRRADPTSSRLAFLDAQLARALAALAATAPASTPSPAAAPTELDSVLSLATARLRRGQLLVPEGDSARAYLDRAAQLDANDPRVAALRADLAAALVATARLVAVSDPAAATTLTTQARQVGADAALLAGLERDVAGARAREEQRRLTERLETARARVQDGALFAPASDSALAYLARLQNDAPELAGLAEAWETFRQAAVAGIQGLIERGEWPAADQQLAELQQVPGGATAASPLATELAARRLQQTYLATASPASELMLQHSVPVVYPESALARGVGGWVDLEFVVDRNGQPQSPVVVDASSPGRFDEAALDAVVQYRYAPFERDGRIYERRLRLRMRFQVQ
jgi:TonB family protein